MVCVCVMFVDAEVAGQLPVSKSRSSAVTMAHRRPFKTPVFWVENHHRPRAGDTARRVWTHSACHELRLSRHPLPDAQRTAQASGSQSSICFYMVSVHCAQVKHQVLNPRSAFTQCHCTVHRSNIRFPILDLLLHSVSAQCIAQTSGSQSSICFYTVSVHSAQLKHLVLNPVSAFMQCHCMKHLHCLCYSVCLHVIEFLFIAPLLYFTNTHIDITHTPI